MNGNKRFYLDHRCNDVSLIYGDYILFNDPQEFSHLAAITTENLILFHFGAKTDSFFTDPNATQIVVRVPVPVRGQSENEYAEYYLH